MWGEEGKEKEGKEGKEGKYGWECEREYENFLLDGE